jgi:hypothetical protein
MTKIENMKKINLLIITLLLTAGATAQQYVIDYIYDDAGNREERIRREIIIPEQQQNTTKKTQEEIDTELAKIEDEFDFDAFAEGQIKVFPNPVQGELKINLVNMSDVLGAEAKLYNIAGNLLETQILNNNYSSIDMNNHPQGIYILRLSKNNEFKEYKIVKK